MKKMESSIFEQLDFISVYRDDIDELYNLLFQTSNKVDFFMDEYEFDSLEDLEHLKRTEAERFVLRINQPYVKISIDGSGATVSAIGGNPISESIAFKIINILKKRKNKFIEFVSKHSWKIGLPLFILGIFGILVYYIVFNRAYPLISYASTTFNVIAGIAFWGSLIIGSSKLGKTRIYLSYKKDSPSFLKRNKDELIIGIVMLIFGAILGMLLK